MIKDVNVRKILFLISSLEYSGVTNRACLLAKQLPRDQFEVAVCALNGQGPLAGELQGAGIPAVNLGWQRLVDLRPLGLFWKTLRAYQPNLIQVSGLPALRFLTLAGSTASCKLMARDCLGPELNRGILGRLDRKLLSRADCVIANSRHQLERARHMGLPAASLAYLPPGVVAVEGGIRSLLDGTGPTTENSNRVTHNSRPLPVPSHARLIAGVGPLEPAKGYRDAIWALDILRHLHNDVHLLLIGTGPDRPRLDRFSHIAGVADRVHYVEKAADVPGLLALAEIVWVPSWMDVGIQVCLEAMAAGKPVVAARWPSLAEIVVDGETGVLITPGDKGDLARQTHLLLENAEVRQRLGEAGRQRVLTCFHADVVADRTFRLMESIVSGPGEPTHISGWLVASRPA